MTRCLCLMAIVALALLAEAQDKPTKVERTAAPRTSAASGADMFVNYCASCHGKDGKGNGPAASALNVPPTDLTALSKKNDGKYPALRVASVLNGEANLAAHGNKEMPVWGRVFWSMSGGHAAEVHQRVTNLNHYIESLQVK